MRGASVLLCGVGGQGTVLASRLVARCAMAQGYFARTAETIGMAQRGGSVVSHVRWGETVASPLIPPGGADVLIGFEPGEAVRCLAALKPGGGAVVCRDTLPSVLDALGDSAYRAAPLLAYLEGRIKRLVLLDGRTIAKACGSAKALNVALLGAAVGGGLLAFPPALLMETLAAWIKPSLFPMNERAFQIGLETGAKEARA